MGFRARRLRGVGAACAVLLAATNLAAGVVLAGEPSSRDSARASGIDLGAALSSDGRFRGAAGVSGSIDTGAWSLVSDIAAGEAPAFAPIPQATAIGPWSAIPSNVAGQPALQGNVLAVAVSGKDLYVGGQFLAAAGVPGANYVAKWNGTSWSALGNGPGGTVRAIAVIGTNVYVGGDFTNFGGNAGDYIARWNGSNWFALDAKANGDGALNGPVFALAASGTDLYVGGSFLNVDDNPTIDELAKWSAGAWSGLGSIGGNGVFPTVSAVYAIAVAGTKVYIGGTFVDVNNIALADRIAVWNGAWSALGNNGMGGAAISGEVRALTVSGTNVYAGGTFSNAGGVPAADKVAKWNGSTWSSLGSAASGDGALGGTTVVSIVVIGTEVYVGGTFFHRDIAEAGTVAKWNGTTWSALGSDGNGHAPIVNNVTALGVRVGHLIVGGIFLDAAKIPTADYVARWFYPPFTDIEGTTFEADIIWVWLNGITSGCQPTPPRYCPLDNVTRGEMASFLARALHLPATATDYFTDDETSVHEDNINRVRAANITTGCGEGKYCPLANVTRAEMATFLVRALGLTAGGNIDYFTDDNTSTHEANINRLSTPV